MIVRSLGQNTRRASRIILVFLHSPFPSVSSFPTRCLSSSKSTGSIFSRSAGSSMKLVNSLKSPNGAGISSPAEKPHFQIMLTPRLSSKPTSRTYPFYTWWRSEDTVCYRGDLLLNSRRYRGCLRLCAVVDLRQSREQIVKVARGGYPWSCLEELPKFCSAVTCLPA